MKILIYKIYTLIFSYPYWERFNRFIITLGLKGLGINNYESHKVSGELFLIRWLKKNYNPKLVFDVGANEGKYTDMCLKYNIKNIYCFEPNKGPYKRISQKFSNMKGVKVFNLGFSNIIGEAKIYDKSEAGTSHATLAEGYIDSSFTIVNKIQLDTIDSFCKANKITNIPFLKIDTEGHEFEVLEGANNLISSNRIDIIHFELNTHNIFKHKFLNDFITLLSEYNLYRLLPNSLARINYNRPEMNEFFFFQNIICIKKDIDKNLVS